MTSDELKKRLGNNIKALRKAWGETQEDLAYAVGLASETSTNSRLSNYENGARYPSPEIITKIARHYRITEHELMYSDFSDFDVTLLTTVQDVESITNSYKVMFPLKETSHAIKNNNFRKAYEMHQNLYNCIAARSDFNIDDIDVCCELYKKSFDEGILEAAANHVGLLLFIGFSLYILTPELYENLEDMDVEISTSKDLLKYGFLPNFADNTQEEYDEFNDVRKEYVQEYNEIILAYIDKLKQSKEYSSLGDYFLALRHLFGFVNNFLGVEMNSVIGEEMLRTFSSIGNKYAQNFLEME